MKPDKKETKINKILKGPSFGYTDNYPQRTMWQEIATEFKGEFKISHNSGNELEIHTIYIPYKNRVINISVSDTRPMKVQLTFVPKVDFKLLISWEDFIERFLKKFGKPEIKLGPEAFDKKYLIKSNKPHIVGIIITQEIQKVMLRYDIYSISYLTDKKVKSSELISVIQRRAGNKEMLREIIELFKRIINNLENAGIIKT